MKQLKHTEMKQLTELKDGQSVLLHLQVSEFQNDDDNIILNDYMGNYFHRICKGLNFVGYNYQQAFYDFNEVMNAKKSQPISKEEFYKKGFKILHEWIDDYGDDCDERSIKEFYDLFQSYHPESFTPEIGKEYEFSDDGKEWSKHKLLGYSIEIDLGHGHSVVRACNYIRPIQQSDEEIKAIELLNNLGYEVNKK